MDKKKVVIGMSGGTDSTVTAMLLKKKGFDVIGVTLKLWEEIPGQPNSHENEIKIIAEKIGILHYVVDCSKDFKQSVIDYFVDEYILGRTPSPCIKCNKLIKWKWLLEKANELNCYYVATGHYVNILNENGLYYIGIGDDPVKDQSYYLWELPQEVLSRAITPLGKYSKPQVKDMVKSMGFPMLAKKTESMGVCFLQKKNYRDFLKEIAPDILKNIGKGVVKDVQGNAIGSHEGFPFYTIGQKKNIDTPDKSLSVCQIIPEENTLVLGSDQTLYTKDFFVENYSFANPKEIELPRISIKVRGLGLNPSGACTLKKISSKTLQVLLENPAWAIAPGQPVVFYCNNRVIGGGYACIQPK